MNIYIKHLDELIETNQYTSIEIYNTVSEMIWLPVKDFKPYLRENYNDLTLLIFLGMKEDVKNGGLEFLGYLFQEILNV